LRADGTLANHTSVCSPIVYRGDRLPAELYGNIFVAEPAANLVSRIIVDTSGPELKPRKAYQGAVGVEDSAVAGFPLTESEFRAYMPKDLRFVLVRRRVDLERYALRFLPTFRKQIELPELPGWTVLVQEDATPQ
jgi:hypothetical protein